MPSRLASTLTHRLLIEAYQGRRLVQVYNAKVRLQIRKRNAAVYESPIGPGRRVIITPKVDSIQPQSSEQEESKQEEEEPKAPLTHQGSLQRVPDPVSTDDQTVPN